MKNKILPLLSSQIHDPSDSLFTRIDKVVHYDDFVSVQQ